MVYWDTLRLCIKWYKLHSVSVKEIFMSQDIRNLSNLHREIAQAKRQYDSVDRRRSLLLSELLLARLEQGLTQQQLAQRSGLRQSAIARLEKGQINPTLETLIKLARALNRQLVLE
jgi:DNA-binding XRE family transcriptional regulator